MVNNKCQCSGKTQPISTAQKPMLQKCPPEYRKRVCAVWVAAQLWKETEPIEAHKVSKYHQTVINSWVSVVIQQDKNNVKRLPIQGLWKWNKHATILRVGGGAILHSLNWGVFKISSLKKLFSLPFSKAWKLKPNPMAVRLVKDVNREISNSVG